MHILYIHQYFATPHGTTGTRSFEFARRWVKEGHRVTVVTSVAQLTPRDLEPASMRLVNRFQVEGIDVVALKLRYHQRYGFLRRVWAFVGFMVLSTIVALRVPRVDVVYATSTPLTVGVPALAGWWLRRRRYVFEVRDVWPAVPIAMGFIRNRLVIWMLRRLERAIYRRARAIVTLSPGMEQDVRRVAPPDTPIVTITNSSDTALFRPDVNGSMVRRQRGWGERVVCVHSGAMGISNGLDIVLRAAQRFEDDSDVHFLLVGDGGEKDRLIRERDRLRLSNLEISDGVSKSELPAIIAAADICLMTVAPIKVLEHNSANKFFDYLSAGKPVLLNYEGWQKEVLDSVGAGLGSRMGDEEAFLTNLAKLRADKSLRESMGRSARTLAESRFSRDRLASEALGVIVSAVDH